MAAVSRAAAAPPAPLLERNQALLTCNQVLLRCKKVLLRCNQVLLRCKQLLSLLLPKCNQMPK